MLKKLVLTALITFSSFAIASPFSNSNHKHRLFVSSQNTIQHGFDVWQIDSGYAYSIFDSVDLYVGTRVKNDNNNDHVQQGFLSGIQYQLNDKVTLHSRLYSEENTLPTGDGNGHTLNAELSGKYHFDDTINLHATLDYDEWQQGMAVGLGFNF